MQFFLGLLSGVVFLSCLGLAFFAGQRTKAITTKTPKTKETVETEKERQVAAGIRKGFLDLMNYDMDTAIGKKVK